MNFFHWDGRRLLSQAVLGEVDRSLRLELEDGSVLEHPRRDDYEAAFRAAGRLATSESLLERYELAAAAQAHWHAAKCNSCVFSAYLSQERATHGWETFVIAAGGEAAEELAEGVDELVRPRLLAAEVEIVSIVLPALEASGDLAGLLACLGALPHWSILELGTEDDPDHGRLLRLGLRTEVEFGYQSEILGFGPQPTGARTRWAPFTELAIRAKPPPREKGHGRAVMADVQLAGIEGAQMGEWGAETAELRQRMLGTGHDQRGKAKVSFVIPEADWKGGKE